MTNLTSLLVAIAVSERRLSYEDCVADCFPEHPNIVKELRIIHLLSHVHGLDGSMLQNIPYSSDGYIDAALIWREAGKAPPISKPGLMYYYWGGVGYWIVGAILERTYGRKFAEILASRILNDVDLSQRPDSRASVCPASGGIGLSAKELLQLCRIHLQHLRSQDASDPIRRLGFKCDVPLPRWPSIGEGVALGWFCYAGAMLGISGTFATILVSPTENAAVALTGTSLHFARHQVLGPLLFSQLAQRPRLLSKAEYGALNLRCFVGVYRKAKLALEICVGAQGELRALVYRRSAGGGYETSPHIERSLISAEEDTFFPAAPERVAIPYIKFAEMGDDGLFKYAITGIHIFSRTEDR